MIFIIFSSYYYYILYIVLIDFDKFYIYVLYIIYFMFFILDFLNFQIKKLIKKKFFLYITQETNLYNISKKFKFDLILKSYSILKNIFIYHYNNVNNIFENILKEDLFPNLF